MASLYLLLGLCTFSQAITDGLILTVNSCPFTIWPEIHSTASELASAHPHPILLQWRSNCRLRWCFSTESCNGAVSTGTYSLEPMAGKYLQRAELTGSGRPVLKPGEIESSLLSAVDIVCEDNPSFLSLKSGPHILTTHRFLWISETATTTATKAEAIPLAAITQIYSAKKSIKSMWRKIDERGTKSIVLTLVLRGKSYLDSFFAKLWEAWRGKAWEALVSEAPSVWARKKGWRGGRRVEEGRKDGGIRVEGGGRVEEEGEGIFVQKKLEMMELDEILDGGDKY